MTPRITVVGLGPAGPDLVTTGTLDAIERAPHRYLRTRRHPAASLLGEAPSFDDHYEQAASLDEVYPAIVADLLAAAHSHGEVLYAVPGSPAVAERTVELLRAEAAGAEVVVRVLPALSFAEVAWSRLGVDPVALGVRLVDGQRFAVEAAGDPGPLLVAQCDSRSVLSDIKLSVDDPPETTVTVLHHLGLDDEVVVDVPWADLDRSLEPDHLTALWIPALAAPVAAELVRFQELVVTLRRECPWDQEQTHASLTRHLLEETYETLEAIEGVDVAAGTGYEHLQEELGDLLFQIYFHATLATEEGQFTLADVARGVHDKLYLRHPHVFGAVDADDAAEVMRNWEQIKKVEKGRDSVMDGIPAALPALLLALKVQKKAANSGFAYGSAAEAYADVESELAEVREDPTAAEVGDLLFAATGVAQHLGVDPEGALRGAAGRFRDRFRIVERLATTAGIEITDADPAMLDTWWRAAKAELSG